VGKNMVARLRSLSALAISLATFGCGGGPNVAGPDGPSGTYNLQTLNGLNIPVIILLTQAEKQEVTGSTMSFNGKGFTNFTSFRKTINGVVTLSTETCTGVFSELNLQLTFKEVVKAGTGCRASYTGVWNDVTDEIAVYFDPTATGIYKK
jgi:hypothetical protein